MVEINNSYDVIEFISSIKFELLSGIDPACQVQLHSLPDILLENVGFYWWISAWVLQLVPWWSHITCFRK